MMNKRTQNFESKSRNQTAKKIKPNLTSSSLNKSQKMLKSKQIHQQPTSKNVLAVYKTLKGVAFKKLYLNKKIECTYRLNILNTSNSNLFFKRTQKQNASKFNPNKIQLTLQNNFIQVLKNCVKHTFPLPEEINQYVQLIIGENVQILNFNIDHNKVVFIQVDAIQQKTTKINPDELIQESFIIRALKINAKEPFKINWQNSQPQQPVKSLAKNISKKNSFNLNTTLLDSKKNSFYEPTVIQRKSDSSGLRQKQQQIKTGNRLLKDLYKLNDNIQIGKKKTIVTCETQSNMDNKNSSVKICGERTRQFKEKLLRQKLNF